jgi:hypothetical protein
MKFKKVGKKLLFFQKKCTTLTEPGVPGSGAGCLKQKTRGPGASSQFLPNTREPAPGSHP